MKRFLLPAFTLLFLGSIAQENPARREKSPDTANRLKEVVIRPYFSTQSIMRSTTAYGLIDSTVLENQAGISFVPAINTIAGVRMEERSPGSYRLSIRGSLLRSPFGIRNIKVYLDEFPLTDAGGNSYFNALDINSVRQIQILKGPQSSIYGANSGGVVLINPLEEAADSTTLNFKALGGSYGLFQENIQLGKKWDKYQFLLSQSYQRSDGYRDHSAMDRKYIQLFQKYDYSASANLKALLFYSDLHYNTPGGLTAAQFAENPRLSRQATAFTKSAIEQKAAIYSKTVYGGLSNEWKISPSLKHVAALYTSYTDFKNPFITNYEHRNELTTGLRTYLEYQRLRKDLNWTFNIGLESTQTNSDISNYDNNQGQRGEVQSEDELKASSNFAFAHLNIDFLDKWLLELSASANLYKYRYESMAPVAIGRQTNKFDVQFMPRVALSYLASNEFSLHASISKGYSPPTISEIRASDQVINVDLQPEYGWNTETGFKYQSANRRFFVDVTGFYYKLNNAIVRRLNEGDAEFFINAGGTKQWGLETAISAWLIPQNTTQFVGGLQLRNAYTWSKFNFSNYLDGTNDYSGNELTGVPKNTVVSSADLYLRKGWSLYVQHNYTAAIPLNDANTVYADKYQLLQVKVTWKNLKVGNSPLTFYVGADNLLDQAYSLGNDLNAAGNRYFNAAPGRNFYAGLQLQIM
ncbi:TonB-dependent receptor [Pedobacter sp.]|uniref:TonB-dependent receptor n=1 Tax=Pedobacter sp. TaxID=1411316 RepID=UPI003D7F993C